MQYESEGIIRRQIVKLITALYINNKLRYVILYPYNRNNLVFTIFCPVDIHHLPGPYPEVNGIFQVFWGYSRLFIINFRP